MSLQNILKFRQEIDFLFRQQQLDYFYYNLSLPIRDERRRFILNVYGPSGIGKTKLMERWQNIADAAGSLSAYLNLEGNCLIEMLENTVQQLVTEEDYFREFTTRYQGYLQSLQQIESDSESFLNQEDLTEQESVRRSENKPPRTLTELAFDFVSFSKLPSEQEKYLIERFNNRVQELLPQNWLQVLSCYFVEGLRDLANKNFIALFFDVSDTKITNLAQWLKELLAGQYGQLPEEILIVIASREQIEQKYWLEYQPLFLFFPLSPFSKEEVREYLYFKKITNEKIIGTIWQLSSGSPLLVATLASVKPTLPVGENITAVEWLLDELNDPQKRQVLLSASCPRSWNREILAFLLGQELAEALFDWLISLPFVKSLSNRWTYHPVVRNLLLLHLKSQSTQTWADCHERLMSYHQSRRDLLTSDIEKQYHTLEIIYHRLCQSPHDFLPVVLNEFLVSSSPSLPQWAEIIEQAGEDIGTQEVHNWGEKLVEGLRACQGQDYSLGIQMFTALLDRSDLEAESRTIALSQRGYLRALAGQYMEALSDFNEAISIAPEEGAIYRHRGTLYELLGDHKKALADFNRVSELNAQDWRSIILCGEVYRRMGCYQEAIADFNRVRQLQPDCAWAIANRGETYRLLGNYDLALADFNEVIELKADFQAAIASRGQTYRLMEQYELALADFERAIDLDGEDEYAIALRGETYRQLERHQEALVDLNRAIQLNPAYVQAIASRGQTYQAMGRYQEALRDFNRALQLAPDYGWAIAIRGTIYQQMGRYQEALADLERALELNPDDGWIASLRNMIIEQLDRDRKVETAIDEDVEVNSDEQSAIGIPDETLTPKIEAETEVKDKDSLRATAAEESSIVLFSPNSQQIEPYRETSSLIDGHVEINSAIASKGNKVQLLVDFFRRLIGLPHNP